MHAVVERGRSLAWLLSTLSLACGPQSGRDGSATDSASTLGEGSSDTGTCNDGSQGCACYGNGTCDDGLVCAAGICMSVTCDDGTLECPCYGNGTCNDGLQCGSDELCHSAGGGTTDAVDSSGGDSTGASVSCGDGTVDGDEECDDGNAADGDGCSATCTVDPGWSCADASPSICTTTCGDGMVGAPVEECDDGNTIGTDACTDACLDAVCGDGLLWEGNETCDDGGVASDDGCDASCAPEPGYLCVGAPSVCDVGIYLAGGSHGVAGNLWVMSLDGSTTVDLGPIGVPLTGMAFHPNGTLYAVTTNMGSTATLGTLDLATAQFTPLGNLQTAGGVAHSRMPDITFMATQLLGWTEAGDDLALINAANGIVTPISSVQGSFGTGLAYAAASDTIFLAPSGSNGTLYTVTPMGIVTAGPVLGGIHNTVKGMSYYDGKLYGMDTNSPGTGDVVTYDPVTGARTVIAPLPTIDIDALAVFDPDNAP